MFSKFVFLCPVPGYLGCFGDASDRALPVGPAIDNEQSVERCFRNCLQPTEYKYAGLQDAQECWCGNNDYDKHGEEPDSDCQDVCTGNSDQICGGGWRLSVYRVSQGVCSNDIGPPTNGDHTITNPPSLSYNLNNFKFFGTRVDFSCDPGYTLHGTSSIECIETGYSNVTWSDSVPTCEVPGYLGCFGDASDRALSVGPAIDNEQSVERCFRNCLEPTEYKYAGLQNAQECWCGNNDYDKHGEEPDSDCQDVCTGNSDQICGGGWRLSVYRVLEGVCSNDIGPPTNGDHTITNPPSLSYNLNNFKFFGTRVDFSCDPGYTLHGASSIECIETGYSNVTWSDSVPTCEVPGYLGCFGDASDRALPFGPAIEYNQQSVERCFRNCLEPTEYKYAGLQDAQECWCGNNDYDKHGEEPDSDCQDVCTGNSDQICGGGWRLSVYRVSQGVCSNDIGPPTNGDHTITNPPSLSYNLNNFKFFGTRVDFSCDPGYTLHGTSSIECIETGYSNVTWSDSVPTCEETDEETEGDNDGLMFLYGTNEGDSILPPNDDQGSGRLSLAKPFPVFDQSHESLYVNTNGVFSFLTQVSEYTPKPFPLVDEILVAVFWADVNIQHNGSVWYREVASRTSDNELMFVKAENIVRQAFVNQTLADFVADWMFVATWDKVPFFIWPYERQNDVLTNTFQAVFVSDSVYSFTIFNYENICWTTGRNSGGNTLGQNGVPAVVGVNAGDGYTFIAVPNSRGDLIVDVDQDTNVNTTGRFVFRIDSSQAYYKNVSQAEVRLVDGSDSTEGRVEVFANGVWGTVCDNNWGLNEANVVCRQLGFKKAEAALSMATFGPGSAGQDIHLDEVDCIGDEHSLLDCRNKGLGINICSHDEDAGVRCQVQDFRLVNGSKTSEGRVEVFVNGGWATVCGRHENWDIDDATVLCRDLGFQGALEASSAVYGVGDEDQALFLDYLDCDGDEASLFDCPNHGFTVPDCYHELDAGVRCQVVSSESLEGVRLVDGSGPHEGRVEVFALGNWGTICDDNWNAQDGIVVCRQLGYNSVLTTKSSAAFGPGTGDVLLDELKCTGNEKHLGECYHRGIGISNCYHSEDAGVVCYDALVRLTGGSTTYEGGVEVFVDHAWGTVCDNNWDLLSANVTCRQLGYRSATEALTNAAFGPADDDVPILLDVTCSGNEDSIFECERDVVGNNVCSHSQDAGVRCEVGVRLAGGSDSSEGRVEVFGFGAWGTVCDDGWDITDAIVICRQLGFPGAIEAVTHAGFGGGTSEMEILLDEVSCAGDEETVFDCQHDGLGVNNCGHLEDAGVRCDIKVGLVNGSDSSEGRVEVFSQGAWGTVCDDNWDITDAIVICRHLGFPGAIEAVTNAGFGGGASEMEILLDEVSCTGDEETIFDCQHNGVGITNCRHSDDAGVRCVIKVRLVDGSDSSEGRVEIVSHGATGTVCDDNWDITEATVICRQLGFPEAIEAVTHAGFGEGASDMIILLDEVSCTGDEETIFDCQHDGLGIHDCGHGDDAGVRCDINVRLMGGSNSSEGRVEVFGFGAWGTVCDDDWDITDAIVICRQLGFPGAIEAVTHAGFGGGTSEMEILLDEVSCAGDEETVFDCQHDGLGVNDCGHLEDAGVRCVIEGEQITTTQDSTTEIAYVEPSTKVQEVDTTELAVGTDSSLLQSTSALAGGTLLESTTSQDDFTTASEPVTSKITAESTTIQTGRPLATFTSTQAGSTLLDSITSENDGLLMTPQTTIQTGVPSADSIIALTENFVFDSTTSPALTTAPVESTTKSTDSSLSTTANVEGFSLDSIITQAETATVDSITAPTEKFFLESTTFPVESTTKSTDSSSTMTAQAKGVSLESTQAEPATVHSTTSLTTNFLHEFDSKTSPVSTTAPVESTTKSTDCSSSTTAKAEWFSLESIITQAETATVDSITALTENFLFESTTFPVESKTKTTDSGSPTTPQAEGLSLESIITQAETATFDSSTSLTNKFLFDSSTSLTNKFLFDSTTLSVEYTNSKSPTTAQAEGFSLESIITQAETATVHSTTTLSTNFLFDSTFPVESKTKTTDSVSPTTQDEGFSLESIITQAETSTVDSKATRADLFLTTNEPTEETYITISKSTKSEVTDSVTEEAEYSSKESSTELKLGSSTETMDADNTAALFDSFSTESLATSTQSATIQAESGSVQSPTISQAGSSSGGSIITQAESSSVESTSTKAELLSTSESAAENSITKSTSTESEVTTSVTEDGTKVEHSPTETTTEVKFGTATETLYATNMGPPFERVSTTSSSTSIQPTTNKEESGSVKSPSVTQVGGSSDDSTIDTPVETSPVDPQTSPAESAIPTSEVTTEESTTDKSMSTKSEVATMDDHSTMESTTTEAWLTDSTGYATYEVLQFVATSQNPLTDMSTESGIEASTEMMGVTTQVSNTQTDAEARCANELAICGEHAVCTDTLNSYRCDCEDGYEKTTNATQCEEIFPCLDSTVKQSCRNRSFVDCVHDRPGQSHCENCLDGWTLHNARCQKLHRFIGSLKVIRINGTVAKFTEDLRNTSSVEFTTLSTELQEVLTESSDATTCKVLGFTNGSIDVEFLLLFPDTSNVTEDVVQEAIVNYFSGNSALLELDLGTVVVVELSLFCEFDSCLNGGTCSIINDEIECTCTEGYIGSNCDTATINPSTSVSTSTTTPDLRDTSVISMDAIIAIAAAGAVTLILVVVVVVAKCWGKSKVAPLNPDSEIQTGQQPGQ
ncbi:uncharacterized protein LOC119741307 [Patiria miniata]|uniref:Uncharacterized protein n=1 Tax=Patiria miniata TaxID=46514 RepID=A0A914BA67_PATMI|nr:uncharacterized protein LOC119741307 [Patiria miniata]